MSTTRQPARPSVAEVLADPVSQELLHSPLLSRLAYTASDGSPRVVPIGYLWKDGQFIICTLPNAPKTRALRRDPRVALTIDRDAMPPTILLVRGTAMVEIVEGIPPEYLEASHKTVPNEQWPAFEAQVRALYKQMARITIQPTWAKVMISRLVCRKPWKNLSARSPESHNVSGAVDSARDLAAG